MIASNILVACVKAMAASGAVEAMKIWLEQTVSRKKFVWWGFNYKNKIVGTPILKLAMVKIFTGYLLGTPRNLKYIFSSFDTHCPSSTNFGSSKLHSPGKRAASLNPKTESTRNDKKWFGHTLADSGSFFRLLVSRWREIYSFFVIWGQV